MQGPPPALLPLLRTPFPGELLAWLYLHPQEEISLTEIASRFGVPSATASREADRLVEAELITERRHGSLRLLRANVEGRLAGPLTELFSLTYGPIAVLADLVLPLVARTGGRRCTRRGTPAPRPDARAMQVQVWWARSSRSRSATTSSITVTRSSSMARVRSGSQGAGVNRPGCGPAPRTRAAPAR
jgi:DNA-binding transcriptional ArsR family regulator